MPRLLPAIALFLLLPSLAAAQGTLVVSQNKCALDKQGQIRQLTDSVFVPIAQELVNEGKLAAFGSAYHAWGDEWNVMFWYTASNVGAFLSAYSELASRVSQRHPGLFAQFLSWCSEHRDNFYGQGRMTTPATASSTSQRD